ncbi:MAG TPA: adenylyl-sulfate kinase [Flavobacteriales bacterium]
MSAEAKQEHLFSTADRLLSRSEKEALLQQRGLVVWMTGLSGSGKTSIAVGLERLLHAKGRYVMVLDGDNVRLGLNKGLGFSEDDRVENIRRTAEAAKLFAGNGTIVICCFVSPTHALRDLARNIIGPADLLEVFVDTPLELCEQRDVKGLYAKARSGEVKLFTGISAPFEAPLSPDVHLRTAQRTPEQSAQELFELLLPRVQRN